MTPNEYRAIQERFGDSAARLAELLGLADGKAVRRHRSGKHAVRGPTSRLMRLMARFPVVRRWLEAEAEREKEQRSKPPTGLTGDPPIFDKVWLAREGERERRES